MCDSGAVVTRRREPDVCVQIVGAQVTAIFAAEIRKELGDLGLLVRDKKEFVLTSIV